MNNKVNIDYFTLGMILIFVFCVSGLLGIAIGKENNSPAKSLLIPLDNLVPEDRWRMFMRMRIEAVEDAFVRQHGVKALPEYDGPVGDPTILGYKEGEEFGKDGNK